MGKLRNSLLLFIILLFVFQPVVFAAELEPKNIETVQLSFLENGESVLSVYYGYPITTETVEKIEYTELINENFILSVSEVSTNETNRYAIVCCSISYKNTEELFAKIQSIKEVQSEEFKTTLFNFYILLDSIANNFNFEKTSQNTISLTIDTSSFINQKYYMTSLDESIVAYFPEVDIKTIRPIETKFYLIAPKNINISNSEQFLTNQLNEVYTEYSCILNNQKLSITLSQNTTEEEVPSESKIASFLESKWYNLFVVGSCLFIVIAIVIMIVIAKSYTKVVEKEEKARMEEELKEHSEDDPKLYWSKNEREMEKKRKTMIQSSNVLIRDSDLKNATESIEYSQYKRKSQF